MWEKQGAYTGPADLYSRPLTGRHQSRWTIWFTLTRGRAVNLLEIYLVLVQLPVAAVITQWARAHVCLIT